MPGKAKKVDGISKVRTLKRSSYNERKKHDIIYLGQSLILYCALWVNKASVLM